MVISPSCIHMLHRCTSDTQSRMAQTEVATVVAQRMRKPTVLDSAWRASAPPCVACGRAAAECRAESDFHRLSFYEATRGLEGLFTATFVSHPRNNRVSALRALLPNLPEAPTSSDVGSSAAGGSRVSRSGRRSSAILPCFVPLPIHKGPSTSRHPGRKCA